MGDRSDAPFSYLRSYNKAEVHTYVVGFRVVYGVARTSRRRRAVGSERNEI